jgi:hypothetical protein
MSTQLGIQLLILPQTLLQDSATLDTAELIMSEMLILLVLCEKVVILTCHRLRGLYLPLSLIYARFLHSQLLTVQVLNLIG